MRRKALPAIIGILAGAIVAAGLSADIGEIGSRLQQGAFDMTMLNLPRQVEADHVAVVEIDRASLAAQGPWPWPRATLAALVTRIAEAKPKALALDILIADRGEEDPAGDGVLVAALRKAPVVLSAALDPDPTGPVSQTTPMVTLAPPTFLPGMAGAGLIAPPAPFLDAAGGLGVLALPADRDARVRAAPLIVVAGAEARPGLALEALRLADDGATLLIDGGVMRLGDRTITVPEPGSVTLWFADRAGMAARTVSAASVLADAGGAARLAGKIVFLGASAPEAGGLRPTARDPLMPSVQIHATALDQILGGFLPARPGYAAAGELLLATLACIAGALAIMRLPPLAGVSAGAGICALAAVPGFALLARGVLVQPLIAPLAGLACVQAAALSQFIRMRAERTAIIRRFSQHLPAEIVQQIADDPSRLKLDGEERIVTALFTDIEGFTALTERVGPRELVALLDSYRETMCGLVIAHGGMVDKVVGDAIHAFFNAPLDVPQHAERALSCATAMRDASEVFRQTARASNAGFGRTRFGIETGPAVVGDVGGGRKLDYTAHGRAINLAARLEAANKRFGTAILVGPGAAAEIRVHPLVEIGTIEPFAGSSPVPAFALADDAAIARSPAPT